MLFKEKERQPQKLSRRARRAIESQQAVQRRFVLRWLALLATGASAAALADWLFSDYRRCTRAVGSEVGRAIDGTTTRLGRLSRRDFQELRQTVNRPLIEVERYSDKVQLEGIFSGNHASGFVLATPEGMTADEIFLELTRQLGAEKVATITHGRTELNFYYNRQRTDVDIDTQMITALIDWTEANYEGSLEMGQVRQNIVLENLADLPFYPPGSRFQAATYKDALSGGNSFAVISLKPGDDPYTSVLATEIMNGQLRLYDLMEQEIIANTASQYYKCVLRLAEY